MVWKYLVYYVHHWYVSCFLSTVWVSQSIRNLDHYHQNRQINENIIIKNNLYPKFVTEQSFLATNEWWQMKSFIIDLQYQSRVSTSASCPHRFHFVSNSLSFSTLSLSEPEEAKKTQVDISRCPTFSANLWINKKCCLLPSPFALGNVLASRNVYQSVVYLQLQSHLPKKKKKQRVKNKSVDKNKLTITINHREYQWLPQHLDYEKGKTKVKELENCEFLCIVNTQIIFTASNLWAFNKCVLMCCAKNVYNVLLTDSSG